MKNQDWKNCFKGFLFIGLTLFTVQLQSSMHVNTCDDNKYVSHGRMYPSVGYFSDETDDTSFGSGTLISLPHKEISGRIVITCCHIFYDEDKIKNSDTILFNLEGVGAFKGKFFNHPSYDHLTSIPSYGVSIFILNEKPNVTFSLPSLNLEELYMSVYGREFIQVGYGSTGNFWSNNIIIDLNKRASFTIAHREGELETGKNYTVTIKIGEGLASFEAFSPPMSCLRLSPYLSGTFIKKGQSLLLKNEKNWGVSSPGDSGGPIFDEEGRIIGIIHGGVINNGEVILGSEDQKEKYFLTYAFYERHKDSIQKEYDELVSNNSEPIQDNSVISFPEILSIENMNEYLKPKFNTNDISFRKIHELKNNNLQPNIICNTDASYLPFNKEWIINLIDNIRNEPR